MRRHLLIACLCLVLGVLVNVLVAWTCRYWPMIGHRYLPREGPWPPIPDCGLPPRPDHFIGVRWLGYEGVVASASDAPGRAGFDMGVLAGVSWRRYGFPFPCLGEGRVVINYHTPRFHQTEREFPPVHIRIGADRALDLPVQPAWGALVGGTAVYATGFVVAWFGPVAGRQTRRVLRLRRGQCPACGYPVGVGSVCSECGGAVNPELEAPR